jgi:hypothetical protein
MIWLPICFATVLMIGCPGVVIFCAVRSIKRMEKESTKHIAPEVFNKKA